VSAHPGLENDEQRRARIRQDQADARLLETQGVDAWLDQWHARPPFDARRGGPDWAAEVARKRQTNRAHALAHCLRGLGLGAQPSVLAALSGVAAPSLLVAGERDADYLRHAHTMASRMPVSAVRVIPGAGHGVPFEAPRRLREAVQSFLTVPTTS
jgi:2-succinyl-6-hydroxy-2,4-cyclohexadiene-1-carboxylate synthase